MVLRAAVGFVVPNNSFALSYFYGITPQILFSLIHRFNGKFHTKLALAESPLRFYFLFSLIFRFNVKFHMKLALAESPLRFYFLFSLIFRFNGKFHTKLVLAESHFRLYFLFNLDLFQVSQSSDSPSDCRY